VANRNIQLWTDWFSYKTIIQQKGNIENQQCSIDSINKWNLQNDGTIDKHG